MNPDEKNPPTTGPIIFKGHRKHVNRLRQKYYASEMERMGVVRETRRVFRTATHSRNYGVKVVERFNRLEKFNREHPLDATQLADTKLFVEDLPNPLVDVAG